MDLKCDHQEADTRLLLHAKHASSANTASIICSPDTDVFVLCIATAHEIGCPLFFSTGTTGTGAEQRIIDTMDVSSWYGHLTCQAVVGLHVFTGCDSLVGCQHSFLV